MVCDAIVHLENQTATDASVTGFPGARCSLRFYSFFPARRACHDGLAYFDATISTTRAKSRMNGCEMLLLPHCLVFVT